VSEVLPEPHRSLWLQEALGTREGAADPPAPPLRTDTEADVCIIGGGYVGLWTAYWLKQWQPSIDVVVLEQELCGGGASGRNGGFVLSWWAKYPSLKKLLGAPSALETCRLSAEAVTEIGAFCATYGIDAHYCNKGWLWTARTRSQLGAWDDTVATVERDAPGIFQRLEPAEVAHRAGSPQHLAGVLEPGAATVQPALLARGLRRVCLERGVRIYEHSRVRGFTRDAPPTARTDGGQVRARTLVIATNAWAAGIRELHRRLVVISSDIVATAPIPDRLRAIGWSGGECITDSQLMIDYYRTTRDGRIAFGKGGWGIALGGWIPRSFSRSPRRARGVTQDLHHAYPQLRDVPITHDWSGPIDRSADGLPLLGPLGGRPHILYGVGWSGNGVGPSVIGGKVLAAHVLKRDDPYGTFPLWGRRAGSFPPDPIRYVGAHVVREAVRRKEAAEAEDRRPNPVYSWFSRFVPAGLEDH
jgi:glycine/D-amino acid oxidase-like deaminating enzyme